MQNQGNGWLALACLSLAQFALVVDDTVVNVALPTIQRDLGFSESALVWVVDAYILPFGGLLLIGGRLADLFGRRKLFLIGVVGFVVASMLSATASTASMLIGMRVVQGASAALVAPAGLALAATLFETDAERTKALGIWGSIAAVGLTFGAVLSGLLTQVGSWRWVFLINLPLGGVSCIGVVSLLPSSRPTAKGGLDVLGGVAVTGGLTLLLLALLTSGTAATTTGLALAGAVAFLVAFVYIERRSVAPMVPLHLIARPRVVIANLLAFTIPASFFGMFFLLTLHMQRVLSYSPLQAGVAYLGFALSVMVGVGACTKLVLKLGARALLVSGMTLSAIGLVWFGNLTAEGSYAVEILPGMMVLGVGGGISMVTVTIFALGNLDRSESGLASGLLNTSQQLGGALGLGCLMALANWRSAAFLAQASSVSNAARLAQLAGSHAAFYAAAAISAAAAVTAGICVPSGLTETVDPTLAAAPER